ncbi:hypothetical protein [Devosia naphthalenivorans]|uniref:hypothetical protein n=1 Tax=Devosia naphthalenivorans TaxID=2082392 RepID=UPI0013B062D7|nr:hypothetical protein [Devosia naphthalenivorans]
MSIGFRRGLLPILFAMIALVFCVHQSGASDHAPGNADVLVAQLDGDGQNHAQHPFHSTGCCALSAGIPSQEFDGVFYLGRIDFAFDAGGAIPSPDHRSKHFRPPRRP